METIDSTPVYSSPWLALREDTLRRSDGSIGPWPVVEGADIALVIALDGDRVHLVEQYRHPLARRCWEFPCGTADLLDPGPEVTAARELREETGLVAGTLTPLGALDVAPSTLTYRCHVFLGTDLSAGETERDPEEADLVSAWFTRAEVERMIADGTLSDAKSVAAYGLLLLRERRG